ncbi:hypothetical protein DLH72_02190 [Candidatus Gracilibacteria bacterium]|nr:MAG: hypothetical protein DLH72_02190 [Candidatus Gracilibacteria bacterium]
MDYTNISSLKRKLGVSSDNTEFDDELSFLIKKATNMINSTIGQSLEKRKIIERVDGTGNKKIYLKNKANDIVRIFDKNGKNFDLDFLDGYIVYLSNNVPKGEKNIIVEYEFGFDETPFEIEEICLDLCVIFADENNIKGQNSENIIDKNIKTKKLGELMITYFGDTERTVLSSKEALSPAKNVLQVLNKYKPFRGFF